MKDPKNTFDETEKSIIENNDELKKEFTESNNELNLEMV